MAEITVEIRTGAIEVEVVSPTSEIVVESGRAAILVEVQPVGVPGRDGADGDPPGTAAALVAAHVAAPDPHAQYLTQTEGDGRYSLTGHNHSGVYAPTAHGHADATGLAPGFMAAADKAKLDGIAAGATQNATDAQLRDRGTHTGSQAIATVTGLQTALDGKQAALGFTAENTANKGVANGYAPTDATNKIPSSFLPSFVDDVIEAANFAALPGTGESGKIYVTADNGKTWRWGGSAYAEISASPGSTDAVPEGASNLYHTGARVLAVALSGLSTATNAVITASDTVLSAFGKLQAQVSAKLNASAVSAFGATLIDDADASAARDTLGLGTAATQASTVFEAAGAAAAAVAGHTAAGDPHTQYHTDARGDGRYYIKSVVDTALAGKAETAHGHTSGEITGLSEAIDDRVAALLVAGSNITLTYSDASNTLTITASGGGGGLAQGAALALATNQAWV